MMPKDRDKLEPYLSDGNVNHAVFNVKYNVTQELVLQSKRPFGVILLSILAITLTLAMLLLIAYLTIEQASPHLLPKLQIITDISQFFFSVQLTELAVLALLSVSFGFLLWDGSRAGCTIGLFLMAYGFISSANIVVDFAAIVEKYQLTSPLADNIYYSHNIKMAVYLLIALYFYNGRVINFLRIDRMGVTLRMLISILIVLGIMHGGKYFQ